MSYEIIGAKGFVDRFPVEEVVLRDFRSLDGMDDRGPLAIVKTVIGEFLVVPESTVHEIEETA